MARDEWRHSLENLAFVGIEADMTIVEVLPSNNGYLKQSAVIAAFEQAGFLALAFELLCRTITGTGFGELGLGTSHVGL